MATVSDPSSSSASSTWTDPYKEFELYLEKAHVSFYFYLIFLFFKFLGRERVKNQNDKFLVDAHFETSGPNLGKILNTIRVGGRGPRIFFCYKKNVDVTHVPVG